MLLAKRIAIDASGYRSCVELFRFVVWGHGGESALCGSNHEHSAIADSVPMATEVVTRSLGARTASIVTMAPDVAGGKRSFDRDSAVSSKKKA